jgi:hypothetical protein
LLARIAQGGGTAYLSTADAELRVWSTSQDILAAQTSLMAEIDRQEIEIGAARERLAMSGALLLFYGLSLWSVWYWRGRELTDDSSQLASLDFSDSGDGGGFEG